LFSKILIANRGEIACRVMRTARRLGVATVAVYSDADAGALHVATADAARRIGPAPARQSYLDIAAILAAARDSGAEAIHPGYGFLSENAEFAEACAAAGLVFIGPPPGAIRTMGSKSAAKALMEAAGVPVVPGYHGDDQSPARLAEEAERIGYPVLIKAVAGGGGRGMRIVAGKGEFARALDGARREAQGAFGDDRVLLERYLPRPRHIEVQVFADTHGNTVHLFERDCSIQRRHQKVVEEAPAPGLSAAQRKALGEAAVAAARAVGYVGAGTVEFVAAAGAFHFIEMNTRLQVEHPVTEAVTGVDLVEWQLRVAAGEELPLRQRDLALRGHAIEARLYAENPARGFLPATGTVTGLRLAAGEGIRIDTGIRAGDAVTPFYDALLAKIVAWGEERETARRRLAAALGASAVAGLATNLGFLARLAGDAEFAAGAVDTGYIERRGEALTAPRPVPREAVAAAALQRLGTAAAAEPWERGDGWRLNLPAAPRSLRFRCGEAEIAVTARRDGGGWRLDIAGDSAPADPGRAIVFGDEVTLGGESWRLVPVDPLAPPDAAELAAGRLTAPMPGRVAQVLVAEGAAVRRGEALMVIEAMKMEHTIAAPRDGVVARLAYAVGDPVEEGAELVALAPHDDERG